MIGNTLKNLRAQSGLTQLDVSKILNIERTTYCKYENDKTEPSLDTLKALTKIYKVDFNCLLKEV